MNRITPYTIFILLLVHTAFSTGEAEEAVTLSLGSAKPVQRFAAQEWRYHEGDDTAWARPDFHDGDWDLARTDLQHDNMPRSGWQGIGWFRLHLDVDSSLWQKPVMIMIFQAGNSSIYRDGELVYEGGTVRDGPYRDFATLTFGRGARHVIAVRYANESTNHFHAAAVGAGFYFSVGLPDHVVARSERRVQTDSAMQMFFTAMALVFAMLHFTLFWFSPKGSRNARTSRSNVYFALFALFTAANVFFDYQHALASDLRSHLFLVRLHRASLPFGSIFALRFIYSVFEERLPKQFWVITAALLVGGVLAVVRPHENLGYVQVLSVVAVAESVRVISRGIARKQEGAWTIALGFLLVFLFSSYDILVDLHLIHQLGDIGNGYPAGYLGLFSCMSIYLARDFAKTNQKILDQERFAKEKELERKFLEADNARKTKELEEARQLQLSMLPKDIPQLPHVEIAVKMETATEVGGDYYDFHTAEDGTLTIAVGDATGHGAKAGTMVSIAKGLFHEFVEISDFRTVFQRFTKAIKFMNLGQLYMGLILVRLKDHTLSASSAGMPPILIYRSATRSVEKVVMKGMPLGSFSDFPYQTRETSLGPGDTVLMMSDGLIEMFNTENETLDEERVVEVFSTVADHSAENIITHLVKQGKQWANGRPQADDVTFVVLKFR